MSKIILRTIVALATLGLGAIALADSYVEVWTCTLEDDKTVEDVQAVNSKWLAYVHENISADITSSIVVAVVGSLEGFTFVDTYPDLATWSNTKTRLDSDEADEIDDLFDDVSECSENSLHKVTPTK
jgi:hypothetical protein